MTKSGVFQATATKQRKRWMQQADVSAMISDHQRKARLILAGCAVLLFVLQLSLQRFDEPEQDELPSTVRDNRVMNLKMGDGDGKTEMTDILGPNTREAPTKELNWDEQLALELLPPRRLVDNPLECRHDRTAAGNATAICCGSWDVNADAWWTMKPTWEVTVENETSYCFSPMQDQEKARFLDQVHRRQWHTTDACRQLETSMQQNSGFGASTRWLMFAFYHAFLGDKPFQVEWNRRRWLYATDNRSSWAYCPSEDISCFYLPISPCDRNVSGVNSQHQASRPNWTNSSQARRLFWLGNYMMRPRHAFRRRLYEMRASLNVSYPCTTMHVRRGDSGLPRPPYRRYAAVQEYIDKAKIQKGDNIVLLTDDESTIEEVKKFHKDDYNWIFLERPRVRGVSSGFDGHIPSGDEAFEMLAIDTELRIGGSCEKIVCGRSGFMESMVQTMNAESRSYTLVYLDTRVSREEAMKFGAKKRQRQQSLFNAIEETNKKLVA